jgi:hypothetical protein
MISCNGPISVSLHCRSDGTPPFGIELGPFHALRGLSPTIAVEGGEAMAKRVAELMVEVLSGAGVKRV